MSVTSAEEQHYLWWLYVDNARCTTGGVTESIHANSGHCVVHTGQASGFARQGMPHTKTVFTITTAAGDKIIQKKCPCLS